MSSILGTVWFTALIFVAGALIGAPLWTHIKGYLPWNKD